MSEPVIDVRFTEDQTLQINGETYDFGEGEVWTLPREYGLLVATRWDYADMVDGAYEAESDHVRRADENTEQEDADEAEQDIDFMLDDYLDQNWQSVTAAVREDDLSDTVLEQLREAEEDDRNRDSVLDAIDEQLEA